MKDDTKIVSINEALVQTITLRSSSDNVFIGADLLAVGLLSSCTFPSRYQSILPQGASGTPLSVESLLDFLSNPKN